MKKGILTLAIGMMLTGCPEIYPLLEDPAAPLEAVIKVNEPQWYTERKATDYDNTSLTEFYAPLPVFFEGWMSSPRAKIASYTWDFGDSSPKFSGFNAAHVYETPGKYTATLTVKSATGETSTAKKTITVLARTGRVFYVDAELGDDANDGLSQGAGAWKTATHAFGGMTNARYLPGDQILFKRGQTFDLEVNATYIPHWQAKYGYMFGAYGTGSKPLIQAVGVSNEEATMIYMYGVGSALISFVDLRFECLPPGGTPAILIFTPCGGMNILFLRCDVNNPENAWCISSEAFEGTANPHRVFSGFFVVDCNSHNTNGSSLFTTASRVALLNSTFDLSNNHVAYLEQVAVGVIDNCTFSRPAFGRTAIRICIGGQVWISNNRFLGWIDPQSDGPAHNGGGTRYNWMLVNFGPNGPDPMHTDYIVFEKNMVTNAETLMNVSTYHHFLARNNTFVTPDNAGPTKIHFGDLRAWDYRPLNDVQFVDNTIELTGGPLPHTVFVMYPYTRQAEYPTQAYHEGVVVKRNVIRIASQDTRYWQVPADPAQYAGLDCDENTIYYNWPDSLRIQKQTDPPTLLTLSEWTSETGNDLNTQIIVE